MTFNDLSDHDREYIAVIYNTDISHQEKIDILTSKYKVVGRTIRNWWAKIGLTGENRDLPRQLRAARERILPEDVDVLLVTACQNKTKVNENLLRNIQAYKDFIEEELGKRAEIVIIPARYRNPVSYHSIENYKPEEWWEQCVDEYLYYHKIEFGDVLISADSRVRPTAVNPLSGYEALAGQGHLIIGHPRVHFKTMPRFKGERLQTMSTTGYVSHKNYTVSKSGDRGQVHHTYGFSVVERQDDNCLVPRPVKADESGEFTDIYWHVKDGKVNRADGCVAYAWGDIHRRVLDWTKFKVSQEVMAKLPPEQVILHDVIDFSTCNPHEEKDLFIKRRKIVEGAYLIDEEIDEAFDTLEYFVNQGFEVKVIQSNHHTFLDRFINKGNWKNDLHNSVAYLKYAQIQQSVDLREYGDIFGYLLKQHFGDDIDYVRYDEPLKINGYQNFHGEFGSNGARPSPTTFRKANTKIMHFHTHSPYIIDGVTCGGTSTLLWQYYNSKGMSKWAHADIVIHKSGKNQLLVLDDNYVLTTLTP